VIQRTMSELAVEGETLSWYWPGGWQPAHALNWPHLHMPPDVEFRSLPAGWSEEQALEYLNELFQNGNGQLVTGSPTRVEV
jgi:hypothetical protein